MTKPRLSEEDRARLCAAVDFPGLLAADGVEVQLRGGHHWAKFRDERTASVRLYAPEETREGLPSWTWKDHGSGAHGDVLGYLLDVRGLGFVEAVQQLVDLTGFCPASFGAAEAEAHKRGRAAAAAPGPPPAKHHAPPEPMPQGWVGGEPGQHDVVDAFWWALKRYFPSGPKLATEYLLSRGIDVASMPRAVAVAGVPGHRESRAFAEHLAADPWADHFARAGLLVLEVGRAPRLRWWDKTVLLGCLDPSGELVIYVQGRRLDLGQVPAKYVNQAHDGGAQKHLFGLPSLVAASEEGRELVICEGAIDALAAHELGMHAVSALSRPGIGDLDALFGPYVADLRGCSRVLVLPDRETTTQGRGAAAAGAAAIAQWLRDRLVLVEVTSMRSLGFGDAKDLGEAAERRSG